MGELQLAILPRTSVFCFLFAHLSLHERFPFVSRNVHSVIWDASIERFPDVQCGLGYSTSVRISVATVVEKLKVDCYQSTRGIRPAKCELSLGGSSTDSGDIPELCYLVLDLFHVSLPGLVTLSCNVPADASISQTLAKLAAFDRLGYVHHTDKPRTGGQGTRLPLAGEKFTGKAPHKKIEIPGLAFPILPYLFGVWSKLFCLESHRSFSYCVVFPKPKIDIRDTCLGETPNEVSPGVAEARGDAAAVSDRGHALSSTLVFESSREATFCSRYRQNNIGAQ